MSTRRMLAYAAAACAAAAALSVPVVARQKMEPMKDGMKDMKGMSMPKAMTRAEKIANAMKAAPPSVSAKATILDWPAKEGAAPEVLRAGTNGWSCFPDLADSEGNDPVCADETWVAFFQAYVAKKTPALTRVGVSYMLAPGGAWVSNSDPYAMKETADNHWSHHGPHVMIAVPDVKALAGLPTEPGAGGPYVMWAGTPYAHIMAPVTDDAMAMMPMKKK